MSIERLSTGTPTTASQVPFYDLTNGQDRRASLNDIITVIQSETTAGSGFITQYSSPGATGFSITVTPPTSGASVFLLISPGGTYATGTIVLPDGVEGQEVLVHCRQIVTALTVTPFSGDSTSGAPTTIAAGGFFRLRFDSINSLWARIG